MADDEPVSGVAISGLTPALGQHVLFPRVQHREPLDLHKVTVDAGFGLKHRPGDGAGHARRPPISFETKLSGRGRIVKLISKRYYIWDVSARNGRTPAARGAACASRRLRGRTQPRSMDGAPLFCPRQFVLSDPVRVRGISSDDSWHRITSHQGA